MPANEMAERDTLGEACDRRYDSLYILAIMR
jgi:hypothetical protein